MFFVLHQTVYFILPCKPLFLHGGTRCFLLRASRYSCTAGWGVFFARKPCILARRDVAFFYCSASPLFLHGGEWCFLLPCKPVILARRGVMFFIALQARYSCTAGCDVFYCPASPLFLHGGAWGFLLPCKPRRVLHGKMRGCNRTTNRIFHGKLHILYWHSPLYGKPCVFLWKNTRLRKIFTQAGVFL